MDIPEIASFVTEYIAYENEMLNTEDNLRSCMLVNKFWFHIAARYLWRKVPLSAFNNVYASDRRQLYASFVEELYIDCGGNYDLEFGQLRTINDSLMDDYDRSTIYIHTPTIANRLLKRITMSLTFSTDQWTTVIKNCRNLKDIDLNYSADQLQYLSAAASLYQGGDDTEVFEKLEILTFINPVYSHQFMSFGIMENLKEFNAGFNSEMDECDGLLMIAEQCPNIEILILDPVGKAAIDGLFRISESCKNLQTLSLQKIDFDNEMIYQDVKYIASRLINLKQLRLRFIDHKKCFKFDGCMALGRYCRELTQLDLKSAMKSRVNEIVDDVRELLQIVYEDDGGVNVYSTIPIPISKIPIIVDEQLWKYEFAPLFPNIQLVQDMPRFTFPLEYKHTSDEFLSMHFPSIAREDITGKYTVMQQENRDSDTDEFESD